MSRRMCVKLDNNYRITSDEYNFVLQRRQDPANDPRKRKNTKGVIGWKSIGYWKSIDQLLHSYSRQVLRDSGSVTFKGIDRVLANLSNRIDAIGERCVNKWGKV